MTRLEKGIIWIAGIAFVVGVVLLEVDYWWVNIEPKRPGNISGDAVFIPSLPTAFPVSRTGDWVNCWFDREKAVDLCRVADAGGRLLYEGAFLPYEGRAPVPEQDMMIDSETTNKGWFQRAVWVGGELVPVVTLRNGQVLIPKDSYAAGKKRLDELRGAQKP